MKHRISLSVPVENTSVHLMVEYEDNHKDLRNLKVFNNKLSKRWALYSDGELEISSDDYIPYIKLWNDAFEYLNDLENYDIFNANKLIIGGGDLQVANLLHLNHTGQQKIRVVDPCTVHIQVLLGQFLPHVIDLSNVDLWDCVFEKYCIESADENNHYDLVCIDLSDEYLNIADSFYKSKNQDGIYNRLSDNGYVIAYMANNSLDLGDKFMFIKDFDTDIPGYSSEPTKVGIFKKVVNEQSEGNN